MSLTARLRRVEAAVPDPVRQEAAQIAAELGMTPEGVLREADALAARYGDLDGIVAGLARELGRSEEQVRREAGLSGTNV